MPAAGVAITLTSGQCWGLFYAVNFQIFHTGSSNKVTLGAPSLCRQAEPSSSRRRVSETLWASATTPPLLTPQKNFSNGVETALSTEHRAPSK